MCIVYPYLRLTADLSAVQQRNSESKFAVLLCAPTVHPLFGATPNEVTPRCLG